MSVQTYGYEAHFKWKWSRDVDIWAIQDRETVSNQLKADFREAFLALFADKLSEEGHWYKINDAVTNIGSYTGGYTWGLIVPGYRYDVSGETIIYFESDIKDASAHNSPQLWQVIKEAITKVIIYLGQHPGIVVTILVLGVLTILAIWLINTTTGAINQLGSNTGSTIITLGILALAGLAIYALFFTGRGRRAASKGYEIGRRGYRAVRGRLE